jgi:hypothetical protein
MSKRAVSVTLDESNLLWLRGQVAATGRRSLSEMLDDLVLEARSAGRGGPATARSVVGTIDIDERDPNLTTADAYVRAQFEASAQRPMLVKESRGSRRG